MLVSVTIARELLAAGATFMIENKDGLTARDVAVAHGYETHAVVRIMDYSKTMKAVALATKEANAAAKAAADEQAALALKPLA